MVPRPPTTYLMAETPTGTSGRTADGSPDSQDQRSKVVGKDSSAKVVPPRALEDIGKLIVNRYQISAALGHGGMGIVYEAFDTQVGRKVAIKLVRAECTTDPKFLTRFRRELDVTSQLRHPSTIRVFEHGETEDGRPYMVMELLTGESLADRLDRGPIPELESLQYARQIAESLSEAHENGIFHRDLKPENIFIETVGVTTVVKVLDFGIAGGVEASRLTQAGEVFGTPQYMSPEQCNGLPLDHRTDIYSLGCILYEMLEGRPPFSASSPMATMLKHVRAKVQPCRSCTPETNKAIALALRKDRARRVQTAGEFAELIGKCIGAYRARQEGRGVDDSITPAARASTRFEALPLPDVRQTTTMPMALADDTEHRRGKLVALGLGGAFLVLVGVLLFGGGRGSTSDDETPTADEAEPGAAMGESSGNLPMNRAVVNTNVRGATVFVDGEEKCHAPCEIKIAVGDGQSHEIRLVKDGYTDVVTNWQPKSVSEPFPALPDMKPL